MSWLVTTTTSVIHLRCPSHLHCCQLAAQIGCRLIGSNVADGKFVQSHHLLNIYLFIYYPFHVHVWSIIHTVAQAINLHPGTCVSFPFNTESDNMAQCTIVIIPVILVMLCCNVFSFTRIMLQPNISCPQFFLAGKFKFVLQTGCVQLLVQLLHKSRSVVCWIWAINFVDFPVKQINNFL